MPIKTGRYFIINVQTRNLAYLRNANSGEPVQARYQRDDPGEQWDVIDRKNGHHSILNVRYPRQYAVSGYRSKVEEQVTGEESDQTWLIKPSSKGQYTISTTDSNRFLGWGLADNQQGTPITLAEGPTNHRNWWMFKEVGTGKYVEVNPNLDNGGTAYNAAAGDAILRAVFLLELAPPPVSHSEPFELDLVIIQEMPYNRDFIRNVTETASKICRPLINSERLKHSNLLIQVIEFEPFQEAYRFRFLGPGSFDNVRRYRGVDFPWTECSGPVIPFFLTKGMDDFQARSSATKVVVLNLRYIPLQNGGREQLQELIDGMIDKDVILILTLSEPHQSDTVFGTDLFQELARLSSGSTLSLPTDGGSFYPCIVDYLQHFDADSIATKISNVVTINLEIYLRRPTSQPLESFMRILPPPIAIPLELSNTDVVPMVPNALAITPLPPIPMPAQSPNNNVAATAPNAPDIPSPQKAFVKSKMFGRDIAVLSMTYILAENPELKRLIHLIVAIHDMDEEDQFTSILETCAQFSIQLASASEAEAYRAEATKAIAQLIVTVEEIKRVHLEGNVQFESLHALKCLVDDEIVRFKPSHPQLARDSHFGNSDRLSNVLIVTIGTSIAVLNIAKEASAVVPIPWVQTVIGGVVSLLNAVAQTRSNYDDMREIATTAGEFAVSCAVICSDHTTEPSKELKRALSKFTRKLEQITKDCDDMSRRNPFWRYFQQNVQKDTLQGIRKRLDDAIKLFQTESQVIMQLDIEDLSRKLDDASLNNLPSHPRYDPAEYLSRSRDDVLGYISGWIDRPNELILWMHGAAGLGKSTVGQQLVHLLKEDDRLAGGVFLTNLTKEHPETVIQMISRQLGEMHPRAIANIAEAARKLNGPHGRLMDYFTAYIIDPIRQLEYPYQLVVVVDGLEEWPPHEKFLAELVDIPAPSPVKFILTSRPSYSIRRVLSELLVEQYPLPPVSQEIIEHYFNHHFEMIDWRGRKPDQHTISRLATHANGLLIWAATVCSLLSYEFDQRYPHAILEQILRSEEKVGTRRGAQLERLYRDGIATLFPEPDIREKLQDFLGAMMVLQEPLSLRDFARLTGISDRLAEAIQWRLAVFQTRGQFKSDIIPPAIQQFHFSFLEFIESTSTEYNGHTIAISTTNAHLMLAHRCLGIVFFELLQSRRGMTRTYSELRGVESYAIKFWPLHFSNGSSRLPLAPSTTRALIDTISDQDMQYWARLFLPCATARFQHGHWYRQLNNIPKSSLLYELAMIIGEEDVTTLSYRLYCLEVAVRLQPIDEVRTWTALGNAYRMLYEHGRYNKTLDEEISVFRHALALGSRKSTGQGSLDNADLNIARDNEGRTYAQAPILTWVALALFHRFGQRGDPNDLDEGISFQREVLDLWPAPHPYHSSSLNNLAAALRTRFEQRSTLSDLDEAITLHQEALDLQPVPHPDRSSSLDNLANVLRSRFTQWGAPNDLEKAIALHREALDLQPAPHPDRSASLNNLAISLRIRFQHWGTSNDLDEAIALHQEALDLWPTPHLDWAMSLDNLAIALFTRFLQRGVSNDLDEAIALHREALDLKPAPHPDRSSSLHNLAVALRTHFEQWGALNELDEAIALHREALDLKPAPHPDHSLSLHHLAIALGTRFEQRGALNDLDEAIALHEEALDLWPAPHPQHSSLLNNLAVVLVTHFQQRGGLNDLDKAIALHREALDLRPAPHPDRFSSLNNLAIALQTRFEHQGATNDRDEANLLHQEAEGLVSQPSAHPDHSASQEV